MLVTVTGGQGNPPASLQYDANDLAFMQAKSLASVIDSTYANAIYYDPSNPLQAPGAYLIVPTSVADSGTIGAIGYGAVVDENTGVSSTIWGGASSQIVLASDGGLTYIGKTGNDTVVAGGGDNKINFLGDTGSVAAYTSIGDDTIVGGDGSNTIAAGAGDNTIRLNAGTALVTVTGHDHITLGSGSDTINVSDGASAYVGGASSVSGSGYTLTFTNGDLASTVHGGAGSYSIDGGVGGGKYGAGSAGDNSIVGGTGAVTIRGGGAGDTLMGGAGDDRIVAALGNETLGGGAGDNLFGLRVHAHFNTSGVGTTDTITDFSSTDILALGGKAADSLAISTFQVSGGNGSFYLEDGTKVVLDGVTSLNHTQLR